MRNGPTKEKKQGFGCWSERTRERGRAETLQPNPEASEWMPRWWLVPAMSSPFRLPEPPLLAFLLSSLLPFLLCCFFLGVFFSAAVRYDLRCGPSLGLVGYRSTTNTLPYWIFFKYLPQKCICKDVLVILRMNK